MSTTLRSSSRPALARHTRLGFDPVRKKYILLGPESVSVLNPTGAAILDLCDGNRTIAEIVEKLHGRYDHVADDDVTRFLTSLSTRRWVEINDA